MQSSPVAATIPATLQHPATVRFWLALLATGTVTGLSAGLLTRLLEIVQRWAWDGSGTNILASAQRVTASHCIFILLTAGIVTGVGQVVLKRLSSGNGIDTTAAIWFHAGRLPALRTLGSAVLSVVVVGLGASLGREGAPKQVGAVFANLFSDLTRLSDEQRRLLVACGTGAGMSASYGVPLGGALFSLEVMRGVLALRYILPALFCSTIAAAAAWTLLPDVPAYTVPTYSSSASSLALAAICGLFVGYFSIIYVRLMTWAERGKPSGWQRIAMPVLSLGLLGLIATQFPQLLGNGKDISQLLFFDKVSLPLAGVLCLLKPTAILLCVRSGVPGGLFTPSLTCGALLGALVGFLASAIGLAVPVGLMAFVGAGAVLSATTQGPVSTVVLLMEMTGQDRSFILPLLMAVFTATLLARSVEPRSVYDARLTDQEVAERQKLREKTVVAPELAAKI